MMHQRDILIAAFESHGSTQQFDVELTKLFGSPFTMLSADPLPTERSRRGWVPIATATEQKKCSQIEQRVVDVTLRDLLRTVHAIPAKNKIGWSALLDKLTVSHSWSAIATKVRAITGPHDEASGFFWAGMLASALCAKNSPMPSQLALNILTFPATSSTVFDEARHPRAGSGNTVKTIKEMGNSQTRKIACDAIAAALAGSSLGRSEKLIVTAVVGAAISADLWRHPSGVRYLLLPAVHLLRINGTKTFSLDTASRSVEKIIDEELGQKWRDRKAW